MSERVIIGRVGMSVLMFKTESTYHPYEIAEGSDIYSLSNFLCFCRHAPGEIYKTKGDVSAKRTKLISLAQEINLPVERSTKSSYSPCAEVVITNKFYAYISYIIGILGDKNVPLDFWKSTSLGLSHRLVIGINQSNSCNYASIGFLPSEMFYAFTRELGGFYLLFSIDKKTGKYKSHKNMFSETSKEITNNMHIVETLLAL